MLHVLYWTLDTAYFWRKSLKRKHSSLDANHNFSNFFYNNANLWLIVLAWNENLLHSSEFLEWNHLLFGIAKWFRSENAVLLAFSTPLFSMLPWAFGFVTNNFQISFDLICAMTRTASDVGMDQWEFGIFWIWPITGWKPFHFHITSWNRDWLKKKHKILNSSLLMKQANTPRIDYMIFQFLFTIQQNKIITTMDISK